MYILPIAGLEGMAATSNLGLLGAASLMHPAGCADFLPLVEPCGFVPPKEALLDVARVADEMKEELGKSEYLLEWAVEAVETSRHVDDKKAVELLRTLAGGLRGVRSTKHAQVARSLLEIHPEWITPAMRETPEIQAVFRYRAKKWEREIQFYDSFLDGVTKTSMIAIPSGAVASFLKSWLKPGFFAEFISVGGMMVLGAGISFGLLALWLRTKTTEYEELWREPL